MDPRLDHPVTQRLLAVMDKKDHYAWHHLTKPGLSHEQLLVHFRHEYWVYVRDFPIMLARILGAGPEGDARAALAENIFEEQTGKLSFGVSHPELFLEMMAGLGFSREQIESRSELAPEAVGYRAFLDDVSFRRHWVVGAAVLTIFVEGSVHERAELEGKRTLKPIDEAIASHPMVQHYGCPPERMRLIRAHRAVEGGHRSDAWRMVLDHTPPGSALLAEVIQAVEDACRLWLAYRDGVARLMKL